MRVAVIGAGAKGLCIGGLLASKGFHVDLFDAQNRAGGRIRKIKNEDNVAWETASSSLTDISIFEKIFFALGEQTPEFMPIPTHQHMWISKDQKFDIPRGAERCLQYFSAKYPHAAKKISKVFSWAQNHEKAPLRGLLFKLKHGQKSYQDFLKDVTTDDDFLDFFTSFPFREGRTPSHTGETEFLHTFEQLCHKKYFPKGGFEKIVEALNVSALRHGVHFHYQCEVISCKKSQDALDAPWVIELIEKSKKNATNDGDKQTRRIFDKAFDIVVCCSDPFQSAHTWLTSNKILRATLGEKLDRKIITAGESRFFAFFDWENHKREGTPHWTQIFPRDWQTYQRELWEENSLSSDPWIHLEWPHATDPDASPRALKIWTPAPHLGNSMAWSEQECQEYFEIIRQKIAQNSNINLKGKVFSFVTPADIKRNLLTLKGSLLKPRQEEKKEGLLKAVKALKKERFFIAPDEGRENTFAQNLEGALSCGDEISKLFDGLR